MIMKTAGGAWLVVLVVAGLSAQSYATPSIEARGGSINIVRPTLPSRPPRPSPWPSQLRDPQLELELTPPSPLPFSQNKNVDSGGAVTLQVGNRQQQSISGMFTAVGHCKPSFRALGRCVVPSLLEMGRSNTRRGQPFYARCKIAGECRD